MTDTVKCIAIDDEPLALDIIIKFCRRLGNVDITTFSDPEEGLRQILISKPDIAFLDIEMENISGLDIASRLPRDTCFIFTTAYLEYALEGFNLDAVDYLHKPFSFERFRSAFAKAERRIGYARSESLAGSITVKQEYSNVNIPLSDILYIEALEGYSKIFRVSGGFTLSRVILKNIGAMLPAAHFVRIHRSFIVPVAKISSFTRQEVTLRSGIRLPVGRQFAADVFAFLTDRS